ncbi:MAG: OadG family protein [Candidatus Auribacterota bacterium]|nr:OadG family protein [Candidatus Auribacterota bacterium]
MDLLQQFVDSELIRGLTTGDKAMASLYVTIMGMSITFVALCVLWGSVSLLGVIFRPKNKRRSVSQESRKAPSAITEKMETDDGEIISVIVAAIAAAGNAPIHSFKVKSIIPTSDRTPQWGRVGRIEQLTQIIKK